MKSLVFRAISEQFQSSFRAISEKLFRYGNVCLVSARLSLKRHYPLRYYFQSSFNELIPAKTVTKIENWIFDVVLQADLWKSIDDFASVAGLTWIEV